MSKFDSVTYQKKPDIRLRDMRKNKRHKKAKLDNMA